MKKYTLSFLSILLLLSSVCFGTDGRNSSTQNINNTNSNFKNLYTRNQSSTMDYGIYNPEKAMVYCKQQSMPDGGIWPNPAPNEEPLPNPEPTEDNCENPKITGNFNTKMAYGCKIHLMRPISVGARLSHSVVKIAIPSRLATFSSCTGVIINKFWVLTAAHCVANATGPNSGKFFTELSSEPTLISYSQKQHSITVDKIIIPTDYSFYQSKKPLPFPGYVNEDFALLHLDTGLPEIYKYEAVTLAREPFQSHAPTSVWTAGFGQNEDQSSSLELAFRKQYFMTNIYGGWHAGTMSGNYHEIYTIGSIPTEYKGVLSAWSFMGPGDSGAPIFLEDPSNHKFLLEGIHSGGIFCNYPGYFAQIPYSYDRNLSIPDYRELITSIINNTVEPDKIRCISEHDSCKVNNIYVINRTSNTLNGYRVLTNGDLIKISSITTGGFPTAIATIEFAPDKQYVFVTNYNDNSISSYKRDKNDQLIKLKNDHVMSPDGSGPIDIKILGNYAYIVESSFKKVSIYHINTDGSLNFVKFMDTDDKPGTMETVIVDHNKYFGLIPNFSSKSISVYSINFSNGSQSLHIKDLPIEPESGNPIKIAKMPGEYSVFYLLTTKKIILMKLVINIYGQPSLKDLSETRGEFDINANIKAKPSIKYDQLGSIWVSTGPGNKINSYTTDNSFHIAGPVTSITTGYPMGMETIGHDLYVTNFNSRMLTMFNNYINLPPQPKYFETENGPSVIKYVQWKIPAN